MVSRLGVTIRFSEEDVRAMGRDSTGVNVMNLDSGQTVAAVALVLSGDKTTDG